MQKKILSIILACFLLTGCFAEDSETTDSLVGKVVYETSSFSLAIPQDWEVIEQGSFTSNVPSEAVAIFRNNIISDIFTANVNIIQSALTEEITSADFATSNVEKARKSLLDFQEISSEEHIVPYGNATLPAQIATFEGRKSATEPIIRFKQLFVVNGLVGYIVTAAYLPTEDETVVNYMDEMINSFAL